MARFRSNQKQARRGTVSRGVIRPRVTAARTCQCLVVALDGLDLAQELIDLRQRMDERLLVRFVRQKVLKIISSAGYRISRKSQLHPGV